MSQLGTQLRDENREMYPYDWCQKARAIISSLQLVTSFSHDATRKMKYAYKLAVGQVIIAITILCMIRQNYSDLLNITVAINDENFNFGWQNEVNVWGQGCVTQDQLENLSTLLRKASLGISKSSNIMSHTSVPLAYIEVAESA